MGYRSSLRDALAQMIVGLGIVPSTTITGYSGDTVTVTDPSFIHPDYEFSWWDNSGEFPAIVSDVTGNVVTLSFEGRYSGYGASAVPVTGLTQTHQVGARVATNIVPAQPNPRDASLSDRMMDNGYPVVRLWVSDSVTSYPANYESQPVAIASLIYQLPLNQPHGTSLQSDLWLLQQQNRADNDLDLVIAELQNNYTISVNGQSHAEFVKQFMQVARQNPLDPKVPLYQEYLDIYVLGPMTSH